MTSNIYGHAHRKERERWEPVVQSGGAFCVEPICKQFIKHGSRWIAPDSRWHLSHDRSTGEWLGPSHASCNEGEGARYGNRKRVRRWAL